MEARPAVFIANRRQYDVVCELMQDSPCRIFTLGIWDVESRHSGHTVIDLFDCLPSAVMADNWKAAWDLCAHFGEHYRDACVVDGLSLTESIADDFSYSLVYLFNVDAAVRTALVRYPSTRVISGSDMEQPIYWDSPDPAPDMLHAVVWWVCRDLDIPWQGASELTTPPASTSHEMRSGNLHGVPSECEISVCESSISLFERRAYHDAKAKSAHPRTCLIMSDVEPDVSLPDLNWALIRKLPFTNPSSDDCVDIGGMFRMSAAVFDAKRVHVLENPKLEFLWRAARQWMRGCLHEHRLARFIARAAKPRVALTPYDMKGYRHSMRLGFEREGVTTISILHGGLCHSPALMRLRKSRGPMAVWGQWDVDNIGRWQNERSRFFKVGCMRPDLSALASENSGALSSSGSHILVLTSQPISPYSSGVVDPAQIKRCWKQFSDYVRANADLKFVIKLHPRYDQPEFYRELFAAISNVTVSSAPLSEWIPCARLAIMFNTMTSAALDMLMAGIPLIVYEACVAESYRGTLHPGACHVSDSQDLAAHIRRLFPDGESRVQQIRMGYDILSYLIEATGDQAAERLDAVIDALADERPPLSSSSHESESWVLDLLLLIANIMSPKTHPDRAVCHHEEVEWQRLLHRRPSRISGDLFYKREMLEPCLIDLVLWSSWRDAEKRVRALPRLIWRLHRALHRDIRVPFRKFRGYILDAFDLECREYNGRDWGFMLLVPILMASPVRILRLIGTWMRNAVSSYQATGLSA